MDWVKCITCRLLAAARRQAGFTLIEVIFAISLFGIVSTSIITVLTSATTADGLARDRSIALELAQQEVEYVRQLSYMNAGTVGGNPAGVVIATQQKQVMGLWYTLKTRIRWVNDPVPTSFATYANYKQVRVTVTRNSDNKQLARVYTYLTSATRQAYGGANNAVINITVNDFVLNSPLVGASVNLYDGPSAPASDITDETGTVTFPGLTPNPTSGNASYYYDILASLAGYTTLWEDTLQSVSPGVAVPSNTSSIAESIKAGHVQLSDSETQNVTLLLYKPATINVSLLNLGGTTAYTGPACVSVGAPGPNRGSQEYVENGASSYAITTMPVSYPGNTVTEPLVPATYVVAARTFTGATTANVCTTTSSQTMTFAPLATKAVPDNYTGGVLTSSFPLTLNYTPTSANLKAKVQVTARSSCSSGSTISGARVDFRDGNTSGVFMTATTNSSGIATFYNVPYQTGYNVLAWTKTVHGTLANQTVSSTAPSGNPPNICIPVATAN